MKLRLLLKDLMNLFKREWYLLWSLKKVLKTLEWWELKTLLLLLLVEGNALLGIILG